jgi:hypothetical protein
VGYSKLTLGCLLCFKANIHDVDMDDSEPLAGAITNNAIIDSDSDDHYTNEVIRAISLAF